MWRKINKEVAIKSALSIYPLSFFANTPFKKMYVEIYQLLIIQLRFFLLKIQKFVHHTTFLNDILERIFL